MIWMGAGLGAASLTAGLGLLVVPRWRRRTRPAASRPRRPGGRIVVCIEKALDVRAPLRDVFSVWGRMENLSRLVPNVREVREVAVDRHRWTMGSTPETWAEWDTRITHFGVNRVLAWETLPGSVVRQAGSVRVRPNSDGGTRVALCLNYVLPPGPFGEQVAALARADSIDEALRAWKASFE